MVYYLSILPYIPEGGSYLAERRASKDLSLWDK